MSKAKVSTADTAELEAAITAWLAEFPGKVICARHLWYEGLEGHGVPTPEDMMAMETVLGSLNGWSHVGDVRYEKFGVQNSYRRTN